MLSCLLVGETFEVAEEDGASIWLGEASDLLVQHGVFLIPVAAEPLGE